VETLSKFVGNLGIGAMQGRVMIQTIQALVSVFVGFILGRVSVSLDRRRRRRALRAALLAEVSICARLARTYLDDAVRAPLYRLPAAAFAVAFPSLLADDVLSGAQVDDLECFAIEVDSINRGLDNVHRALENGNGAGEEREVNRLQLKCTNLIEAHDGQDAFVTRARRALVA
jgi:hypothetical protein